MVSAASCLAGPSWLLGNLLCTLYGRRGTGKGLCLMPEFLFRTQLQWVDRSPGSCPHHVLPSLDNPWRICPVQTPCWALGGSVCNRDALPWGLYRGCPICTRGVSGKPVTDLRFAGHACDGKAEIQMAVSVPTKRHP